MPIKKIIEVEVRTKKGEKNVESFGKKLKKTAVEGAKSMAKVAVSVKKVGTASKSATNGLKNVARGFKGIGLALKAAGIGLVIGAFVALKDILSQNQKVLDVVSSVLTTLSLVFGEVTEAVTSAFNAVTKTNGGFDASIKIIKNLLTIAITPLKLAFFAIKAAVIATQLAWEQSFLGQGRPEKIKELKQALFEVGLEIKGVANEAINAGKAIVENFSEAIDEISGLVKAIVEETKKIDISKLKQQADIIVEGRKAALRAEVEIEKLRAQSLLDAEKQRQIRDDESIDIQKRIKANEEIARILEKAQVALLQQQKIRVDAAAQQAKITGNLEDSLELQRQQNELIALEEELAGQVSEQLVNKIALEKESLAITQVSIDGEIERGKIAREFNEEQINNDALRLEQKALNLEIEKQIELDRLQSIIDSAEAGTQARAEAEQNKLNAAQEFTTRELDLDRQRRESKIKTLDTIIGIAGEESKLGRAVLIAKQLIAAQELLIDLGAIRSTATRAVAEANIEGAKSGSAIASGFAETLKLGFPAAIPALIGYAASAIGIVGGVVSAIKGVKSVASSVGAPSGGSSPSLNAPKQVAPQFNVVGTSAGSQVAESISQRNNEPIKVFVTASDVTTQQQLDRNKVETSTFG